MTTEWKKLGAIAGLVIPIPQMTGQGFIQVGGVEPSFAAPALSGRPPIAFAPYLLFLLWVIVVSVILLRRS